MIWELWKSFKMIDAAAKAAGSARSYSTSSQEDAWERERRARRQIALERARLHMRGFLQGFGVEMDKELEHKINRGWIRIESGRKRLMQECFLRFDATNEMEELAAEIAREEVAVGEAKVAMSMLKTAVALNRLEQLASEMSELGN